MWKSWLIVLSGLLIPGWIAYSSISTWVHAILAGQGPVEAGVWALVGFFLVVSFVALPAVALLVACAFRIGAFYTKTFTPAVRNIWERFTEEGPKKF